MLQAFTDKYLGLDCNGFVGNYLKRTKLIKFDPNDYHPKDYYTHAKGVRKSLKAVSDGDLLVWANFQHIAIIDGFGSGGEYSTHGGYSVNVYQSTSGGPQESWHELMGDNAKNGLFSLSPASKVGGLFYLVTLGLE